MAAATQNQALSALLFLYKEVLAQPLPCLEGLERAKRPVRRPTVLTEEEARRLLAQMRGTKWRPALRRRIAAARMPEAAGEGRGCRLPPDQIRGTRILVSAARKSKSQPRSAWVTVSRKSLR
ncbi:MAG TPA: hypothetical protein VNK67_14185 [Burkholderiales bacterium]|nr:hypothetical protein [Burkholderiales bacterium]